MKTPDAVLHRVRSVFSGAGGAGRAAVCALAATSLVVAGILSIIGIILAADARARIRAAETQRLQVAEDIFSTLDERRQHAQLGIISTLSETPTLTATLDAYDAESAVEGGLDPERESLLRRAAASEARTMAQATGADAVAILSTRGRVIASAGPAGDRWGSDHTLAISPAQPVFEGVVALPTGAFRISGATLRLTAAGAGTREVGALVLATSLDTKYARELTTLARAGVLIVAGESVAASTIPQEVASTLLNEKGDPSGPRILDGREYVVHTLLASDQVRIYLLASIDDAARDASGNGLPALRFVTLGCFLIAAVGFGALLWPTIARKATSSSPPASPATPGPPGTT